MSTDSSFSQCTCSATCNDGQNPQHTCYRDGSAPWTPSHVSCRQSSSGPSRSIRQHKSVRSWNDHSDKSDACSNDNNKENP